MWLASGNHCYRASLYWLHVSQRALLPLLTKGTSSTRKSVRDDLFLMGWLHLTSWWNVVRSKLLFLGLKWPCNTWPWAVSDLREWKWLLQFLHFLLSFLVYGGKWLGQGSWPLRKGEAEDTLLHTKEKILGWAWHSAEERKGNSCWFWKTVILGPVWEPAKMVGMVPCWLGWIERNWAIAPGWEEETPASSSLWGGLGQVLKGRRQKVQENQAFLQARKPGLWVFFNALTVFPQILFQTCWALLKSVSLQTSQDPKPMSHLQSESSSL